MKLRWNAFCPNKKPPECPGVEMNRKSQSDSEHVQTESKGVNSSTVFTRHHQNPTAT